MTELGHPRRARQSRLTLAVAVAVLVGVFVGFVAGMSVGIFVGVLVGIPFGVLAASSAAPAFMNEPIPRDKSSVIGSMTGQSPHGHTWLQETTCQFISMKDRDGLCLSDPPINIR